MTVNFIGEAIPEGADRAWFDRFNFEDPYSGSTPFCQTKWAIDRENGVFLTYLNGPGEKLPEELPAFYALGFKDGTVIRLELFSYYEIFRKESELGMHTHYVERAYVPAGVSYSDNDLREMIKKGWTTFVEYDARGTLGDDQHLVFADDCIKKVQG
ncbi:MAG: hypothetical protein L0I48_02795 [Lactococcus plantarum]|nr:hypothetical protein [Lactococcus plantarum]MDN6084751.1 hypothetical protein [Lactococcus plantarum]